MWQKSKIGNKNGVNVTLYQIVMIYKTEMKYYNINKYFIKVN